MSKQNLEQSPSSNKLPPYGTFSKSKHSITDKNIEKVKSSNGIDSFPTSTEDQLDNGDNNITQLVEISMDPDTDTDTDIGDTTKLLEVKSPSKKSVDLAQKKNPCRTFLRGNLGIILAFTTSLSASLASFVTKYIIEEKYSATICLFWRSPIILTVGICELLYHTVWNKNPIFATVSPCSPGETRKTFIVLILCRGIMGPLAVLTQFYAFFFIELGDAQTIIYSTPIFVTFFAHYILKESWGIIPFLAALLTIIGVMIISKPNFITGSDKEYDSNRTYGVLLAIAAMILNTFIFIFLRFLKDVHSSISIFLMAFATMLLGLTLSVTRNEFDYPHKDVHTAAFFALAIFTCIGAISLTLSLQYEEAGLISLIRCGDVIFSFLLQMALGVFPDRYSIGGAFIVLFCIFVVFFRKYLTKLSPEHCLVKHLWFLLK